MMFMFWRRGVTFTPVMYSHFLSKVRSFSLRATMICDKDNELAQSGSLENGQINHPNHSGGVHLSPLFSDRRPDSGGYNIELSDPETWQISSCLAQAWRGKDGELESRVTEEELVDDPLVNYTPLNEEGLDFDEIEDMRIRGNLFYKLEKSSKEFEEYNFEFRGKKSSRNKNDQKKCAVKENMNHASAGDKHVEVAKKKHDTLPISAVDGSSIEKKKLRTPTFNQLTGPYHEPFCLDIFISKGSVRACIIHRVTSNVVVVAHSISKDMKFDLASTRDSRACVHVGSVLAQRALADDIHDAIYTPRKGDKLEGKLQIVLQSIIDNGVNVKVKFKQRRIKKAPSSITA